MKAMLQLLAAAGLVLVLLVPSARAGVAPAEPCSLVVGDRFVAIGSTSSRGQLCVDSTCQDVAVDGIGVVAVSVREGQLASFAPEGSQPGCAAKVGRAGGGAPSTATALVTGAFTLVAGVAGMLGSLGIEYLRARRDRIARSLQWLAEFRQRLKAFAESGSATVRAPPITAMDWQSYKILAGVETSVAAIIDDVPPDATRTVRSTAVSAALAVIDRVEGL